MSKAKGQLSTKRVVSYALGDVANNLAFQMTSMFLMVYMTDIVGISAALAGTIYAVTKVWAGVADLIAGNTVDKVNTKWGRLRPWILWGSTPLAITLVMLFSATWFPLTPGQMFVYILLVDALFQLCYSFVNIPYGSLSAAMTQDSLDRSRLSGARSIASAITGVALAAIIAPQFQGIATRPADEVRIQFTITCAVLGVLAVLLYLFCFANTRETVPKSPGKSKFSTTMKMVGKNRPLLVLCLGAFFLLGAMFTMNAVAMYYTRAIIGNASFFVFLMLAQTIGTISAASFVPAITVSLGKRKGYVAFAFVAVLGYLIAAIVPQGGGALVGGLIAWFVFGVGSGGTNSLMFSMQADTVDYGEWKTGTRSEGGSYSILSMIRKTGQGLGGAVGGGVIAAFGYSGKAAEQTADAIFGLRVATGWVPAALGVVAALVIWFYPLTEKAHREMVDDLNDRRDAQAREDVSAVAVAAGGVATLVATRPVVTFFEHYGSGADVIGRTVADRLGVPYVGQRLSSEQLELQAEGVSGLETPFDRFLKSYANTTGSTADLSGAAADQETDRAIADENTREVLESVRAGGVILGRNATTILSAEPRALHVRLTAPVADRVRRAAAEGGFSPEVAAERQQREDVVRVEMSRLLYGWDPDDDVHYDLVVNTSRFSVDETVDLILNAYRVKNPG